MQKANVKKKMKLMKHVDENNQIKRSLDDFVFGNQIDPMSFISHYHIDN